MASEATALHGLSETASTQATYLVDRLIARTAITPQDVETAYELCAQSANKPTERYVLALAIAIVHEARDHFGGLAEANARLLLLAAEVSPPAAAARLAVRSGLWEVVYRNGHTLAELHHGASKERIVESASSLIDVVAQLPAHEHAPLASLSLMALTTALIASHATHEPRLILDIDVLAQNAIGRLPSSSLAAQHWWVERTLLASYDATQRRANEMQIAELLERSANAATHSDDALVVFKHSRNLFEFARRTQDLTGQRNALDAMQGAYKQLGARRRALGMRLLRMQALYALDDGDVTAAEHYAHAAIKLAQTLAAQPNDLMAVWNLLGIILYKTSDRFDDAAAAMRKAARHAVAQHRELLDAAADLLECRHFWRDAPAQAREKLRSGLRAANAVHYTNWLHLRPTLAGWIAARGIEQRIEAEFCAQVIKQRRLPPPVDAPRDWPWKLRVQVLGGYALAPDGTIESAAKTSEQRPHEVVQALVLAGPAGLTRAGLARALYGRAPPRDNTATNMALSRARKLVGDPSLIESDGQRTRLNPREVYVDLWALNALDETLERDPLARCEHALALYKGSLLEGLGDPARHRLAIAAARDRFVALIESAIPALAPETARAILARAIQAEPAEERLYRLLIESLISAGEIGRAKEMLMRYEIAMTETRNEPPSAYFLRTMTAAINTA